MGRHPESDIFVGHPCVARTQCFLIWDENQGGHFVDCAWFRPVFVNGRKVQNQERLPVQLGDRISVETTTFVYELLSATPTTFLANVEQRDDDTHADLRVRQEWIDEGRSISAEIDSETFQIVLPDSAKEGVFIMLRGQALHGTGNLLLRICIVN